MSLVEEATADIAAEVSAGDVELLVAGVAAQLLEAVVELVVFDVTEPLSVLTVLVFASSVDVATDTAESVDCSAITPPRPTRVATLAVATALRARPAGWGRFLRGFASGISRSFGWKSMRRITGTIVRETGKRSMRASANAR